MRPSTVTLLMAWAAVSVCSAAGVPAVMPGGVEQGLPRVRPDAHLRVFDICMVRTYMRLGDACMAISRRGGGGNNGGVTMLPTNEGQGAEAASAALDAYMAVARSWPSAGEAGAVLDKALAACIATGDVDAQVARLQGEMRGHAPGLTGALLFRLQRTRLGGKGSEATLQLLLDAPDRHLPKCKQTETTLSDALDMLLKSDDPKLAKDAQRCAELLTPYRNTQMPDMWLAVGKMWAGQSKEKQARITLEMVARKYPASGASTQAKALLKHLGVAGADGAGVPLAVLLAKAAAYPHLYEKLGDEYSKAGKSKEARQAYERHARRFNSAKTSAKAVQTWFAEKNAVNGLLAARKHLLRFPLDGASTAVASRARQSYLALGKMDDWLSLCLQLSESGHKVADLYLDDVTSALVALQFETIPLPPERLAKLKTEIAKSRLRGRIDAAVAKDVADIRGLLVALYVTPQSPDSGVEASIHSVFQDMGTRVADPDTDMLTQVLQQIQVISVQQTPTKSQLDAVAKALCSATFDVDTMRVDKIREALAGKPRMQPIQRSADSLRAQVCRRLKPFRLTVREDLDFRFLRLINSKPAGGENVFPDPPPAGHPEPPPATFPEPPPAE
jgi:hypothetical protein